MGAAAYLVRLGSFCPMSDVRTESQIWCAISDATFLVISCSRDNHQTTTT